MPAPIAALLLIAASALAARYFGGRAFPIAALSIGAACFALCAALRKDLARNAAMAFGVAAITLGIIDLILRATLPTMPYGVTTDDGFAGSFGTSAAGDRTFRESARRRDNGAPIYDVTYTIDPRGYRRTEGAPYGSPTVLFFGDSFTFGMGLEDDETIPSQFSASLGNKYTVVNLARPGFGPHRMLRAIEIDAFAKVVSGKPHRAYFMMIRDHLRRSVGLIEWNQTSPRYVLGADGIPRFMGRFVDDPLARLLNRLDLAGGLPRLTGIGLALLAYPESHRLDLTAAIVARSAELLKARHGAELIVLLWDDVAFDDIEEALAERGVRAVRVSGFLRDPDGHALFGDLTDPALRILAGIENHPSATASRIIGAALALWQEADDVSPGLAAPAQSLVGADRP